MKPAFIWGMELGGPLSDDSLDTQPGYRTKPSPSVQLGHERHQNSTVTINSQDSSARSHHHDEAASLRSAEPKHRDSEQRPAMSSSEQGTAAATKSRNASTRQQRGKGQRALASVIEAVRHASVGRRSVVHQPLPVIASDEGVFDPCEAAEVTSVDTDTPNDRVRPLGANSFFLHAIVSVNGSPSEECQLRAEYRWQYALTPAGVADGTGLPRSPWSAWSAGKYYWQVSFAEVNHAYVEARW
jgi:hypothetical protein